MSETGRLSKLTNFLKSVFVRDVPQPPKPRRELKVDDASVQLQISKYEHVENMVFLLAYAIVSIVGAVLGFFLIGNLLDFLL